MLRARVPLPLLPLLLSGCLVLIIQAPQNGEGDGGQQEIQQPDGGVIYVLPDGGTTPTQVEAICRVSRTSGSLDGGTADIVFDGQYSEGSPGAEVDEWSWKFGDGTSMAGANSEPSHQYTKAGTYTATLTATDNSGASGSTNCPAVVIGP